MADCLYNVGGKVYTESQLREMLPHIAAPGNVPLEKYSALANLRVRILTGEVSSDPSKLFSEFSKEFDRYGITLADVKQLVDTDTKMSTNTSTAAKASPGDAPKKKPATTRPKPQPTSQDRKATEVVAKLPPTKPTSEETSVVHTFTAAGSGIEVYSKGLPEGHKAPPANQLLFRQGNYYLPVRIFADPELMELVVAGSRGRMRNVLSEERAAKLSAKFGVTPAQAYEVAREVALRHRERYEHDGSAPASNVFFELNPKAAAKPTKPAQKPAKAAADVHETTSATAKPVTKTLPPEATAFAPKPPRVEQLFVPDGNYRYRNKSLVFEAATVGSDGRRYFHFRQPGVRFTTQFVEGEPALLEVLPEPRNQFDDGIDTTSVAGAVVTAAVRMHTQVPPPPGTYPSFPVKGKVSVQGDGPVYTDVDLKVDIDTEVMAMLELLDKRGYTPLVVGGSVRDAMEGREVKDIDIEVYNISLDRLAEELSPYGSVDMVGKSFGVLKFRPEGSDMDYDFSVPRRESKSGTGTRGFEVEFDVGMTMEEAARRRDFTFNALGWNPVRKILYDYYGGLNDLRDGVMRATSEQFAEDPLRVLRALQFQSRMGLEIDPATMDMMKGLVESGEMDTVSKERIGDEFKKWATKGHFPWKLFDFLRGTGYGAKYLPELMELANTPQDPTWHPEGNVEEHTMQVLARASDIADRENLEPEQRQILLLAALLHDIAKPQTTKTETVSVRDPDTGETSSREAITAKGHEAAGAILAERILQKLGAARKVIDVVVPLIREHLAHASIAAVKEEAGQKSAFNKLVKRLAPANVEQLMLLMEADMMGRNNARDKVPPTLGLFAKLLADFKKENSGKLTFEPILKGRHLIAAGLRPGPLFSEVLDAAEKAQLDGSFKEQPEAVEWLSNFMASDEFSTIASRWKKDAPKRRQQVAIPNMYGDLSSDVLMLSSDRPANGEMILPVIVSPRNPLVTQVRPAPFTLRDMVAAVGVDTAVAVVGDMGIQIDASVETMYETPLDLSAMLSNPDAVNRLLDAAVDSAIFFDGAGNKVHAVIDPTIVAADLSVASDWFYKVGDPSFSTYLTNAGIEDTQRAIIGRLNKITPHPSTAVDTKRMAYSRRFFEAISQVPVTFGNGAAGEALRTSDGTVYGELTEFGGVVIYPTHDVVNTPIKEFGHVFMYGALLNNQPEYDRLLNAVSSTVYYDIIDSDPNFADSLEPVKREHALAMAVSRAAQDLDHYHPVAKWVHEVLYNAGLVFGEYGFDAAAVTELTMSDISELYAPVDGIDVLPKDLSSEDIMNMEEGPAVRLHIASSNMLKGLTATRLRHLQYLSSMVGTPKGMDGSFTDTVITAQDVMDTFKIPMRPRILNTLRDNGVDPDDLRFVDVRQFNGMGAQFLIADNLSVGDVLTASGPRRLMGGSLFPFLKNNLRIGAVWASASKEAASTIVGSSNAEVSFITLLDHMSIMSNEATMDVFLRNVEATGEAGMAEFIRLLSERVAQRASDMQKLIDLPMKKKGTEDTIKNHSAFIDALAGVQSVAELRERFNDMPLGSRAVVSTDIMRPGNSIKPKLGLHAWQVNNNIPSIEEVVALIAERGLSHVPANYAVVALRVDRNRRPVNMAVEYTTYGMRKEDVHPNYPWYIFGEVIGILENAVPSWALSNEYANRAGVAQQLMTKGNTGLTTAGSAWSFIAKSYMDRGATLALPVVGDGVANPVAQFMVLMTRAFPNVPVKIQDVTTREEAVKARKENILTSMNGAVYGYFDEYGTLHLSMKDMSIGSITYHFGRLFLHVLKHRAPSIYQRGVDLVNEPGNPYKESVTNNLKSIPEPHASEIALSMAIADRGAAFMGLATGFDAEFYKEYDKQVFQPAKKAAGDDSTLRTELIYGNLWDNFKKHRDWLRSMHNMMGRFTGITSATTEQLSAMDIDEYLNAMFSDMVQAQPIMIGDYSTASFTEEDMQKARTVDGVRFQVAEFQGEHVAADRAFALLEARHLENIDTDADKVLNDTGWYRGPYGNWYFDDTVVPPKYVGNLPGHAMHTLTEQAAAVIADSYDMDPFSKAILQELTAFKTDGYNNVMAPTQNLDALLAFDEFATAELTAGRTPNTDVLSKHPAFSGVPEQHLQARVAYIATATHPWSKKMADLRRKWGRGEAPKTFPVQALELVTGDTSVVRHHVSGDAAVVEYSTRAGLSHALGVYGENPYTALSADSFYRDGVMHTVSGVPPTSATLDAGLDAMVRNGDAVRDVAKALVGDGLAVDRGSYFTTATDPAVVARLRELDKLPSNIEGVVRDGLTGAGVSDAMLKAVMSLKDLPQRVASWLESAGELSFSAAFNFRMQQPIESDGDIDPLVRDFVNDVVNNPDISPDDWLVLVSDDLYSGRLPKWVFDEVMSMHRAMGLANGKNSGASDMVSVLKRLADLYSERLVYMIGSTSVQNAFLNEVQTMMTEQELRNFIGEAAGRIPISSIIQQAAALPAASPDMALQAALEYIQEADQPKTPWRTETRPPGAVEMFAWGMARKKLEATVAFLEQQLETNGHDPETAGSLRVAREAIDIISAALVKAGAEQGRALAARRFFYSQSDISPDQYVADLENDLFGPAGQRRARRGFMGKEKKYQFTAKERAAIKKEYQEFLAAKAAVARFAAMHATRVDSGVNASVNSGLRVLRARGPLSAQEFQAMVDAAMSGSTTTRMPRTQVRMHTGVNSNPRLNAIANLVGHVLNTQPGVSAAPQIHQVLKAVVPDIELAEIMQVLYYSDPAFEGNIKKTLTTAKKAAATTMASADKLVAEVEALTKWAATNPGAEVDAKRLKSIRDNIHNLITYAASMQELDDVGFGKVLQDLMKMGDALDKLGAGDSDVSASELAAIAYPASLIRHALGSVVSAAEARIDAQLARVAAADMTVLAELAPKPTPIPTAAEQAARLRLSEKRASLRKFYDAYRVDKTGWDRFKTAFGRTAATVMAAKAMFDLSYFFIQGALSALRFVNPIHMIEVMTGRSDNHGATLAKNLKRSIEVGYSEFKLDSSKTLTDYDVLQNHVLYAQMVAGGVDFTSPKSIGGVAEELFQETLFDVLASKLHVAEATGGHWKNPMAHRMAKGFVGAFSRVRNASEASFSSYLNAQRANLFTMQYRSLERSMGAGYVPTLEDIKMIGKQVNIWTARAGTDSPVDQVGVLFWAYRLMVSKTRFLINVVKDPVVTAYAAVQERREVDPDRKRQYEAKRRIMARRSMDNIIAAMGAGAWVIGGLKMVDAMCPGDADVMNNPRRSDFMKVRCGRRAWDLTGGFAQYMRLGTQMWTKIAEGQGWQEQSADPSDMFFNQAGYFDLLMRFVRGKLTPIVGEAGSVIFNQDFFGNKLYNSYGELAKYIGMNVLSPLYINELAENTFTADPDGGVVPQIDEETLRSPWLSVFSAILGSIGASEMRYETGKRQDSAVNKYLDEIGTQIPSMNMPKGRKKKDDPDTYAKIKVEYDKAMVDWVRDEITAGRRPSKAQIKQQAKRALKQLTNKYPKARK